MCEGRQCNWQYIRHSRGGANGITFEGKLLWASTVMQGLALNMGGKVHICNVLLCPSALYSASKYRYGAPLFHGKLRHPADKPLALEDAKDVVVVPPAKLAIAGVETPADLPQAHVATPEDLPRADVASSENTMLQSLRVQFQELAAETMKPFAYIDLTICVAMARLQRRRIVLDIGGTSIDVLEEFALEMLTELRDCQEFADRRLFALGLGRCEHNASTECTWLKVIHGRAALRQHSRSLHVYPIIEFLVHIGLQQIEPCDGRRCGEMSQFCLCFAKRELQSRGKSLWPVPADGDCFWHAFMWWLGIDTQGEGGMQRRMEYRQTTAAYIREQCEAMTVDSVWYACRVRIQKWLDASALVEEPSASPQTPA